MANAQTMRFETRQRLASVMAPVRVAIALFWGRDV